MELPQEEKIQTPMLKRMFDVIFTFFIIIMTLPINVMILAIILFENVLRKKIFAPLLYYETRISQGKPFRLIKFNIFQPHIYEQKKSDKHSKELERDKKNLSFIGYFLKQIYIDELPQLFNVLKGDMSMVGPRPVYIDVYNRRIAKGDYTKCVIKAGITGNFQSQKGITEKTDIALDKEYIEFCKSHTPVQILLNDIKIILRTLRVILRARGI